MANIAALKAELNREQKIVPALKNASASVAEARKEVMLHTRMAMALWREKARAEGFQEFADLDARRAFINQYVAEHIDAETARRAV